MPQENILRTGPGDTCPARLWRRRLASKLHLEGLEGRGMALRQQVALRGRLALPRLRLADRLHVRLQLLVHRLRVNTPTAGMLASFCWHICREGCELNLCCIHSQLHSISAGRIGWSWQL